MKQDLKNLKFNLYTVEDNVMTWLKPANFWEGFYGIDWSNLLILTQHPTPEATIWNSINGNVDWS